MNLLLLLVLWQAPLAAETSPKVPVEVTAAWPVLAGGRLKPLQSYARDSLIAISGKERLEQGSALEFLWACHLNWDRAGDFPVVLVRGLLLRQVLGLDVARKRFSYRTLIGNPAFQALVKAGNRERSLGRPLTELQREALGVYARLERQLELAEGTGLLLIPAPSGGTAWWPSKSLVAPHNVVDSALVNAFATLQASYREGDADAFRLAAAEIAFSVRLSADAVLPSPFQLQCEIWWDTWKPSRLAAIGYLAAFLLSVLLSHSKLGRRLAWCCGGLAFLVHGADLLLRGLILGHAPVTTMGESLVLMAWAVVALGLFFDRRLARPWARSLALLAGGLVLLFAAGLPLDAASHRLASLLVRSAWLSLHVGTILLSFAAFALAMVLAHRSLWWWWRYPQRSLRPWSQWMDRLMWLGLLFLAVGMIAGSVWAEQTWGRLWGWGPQETWSLITLVAYLLLLHTFRFRWFGPFGQAIGAILAFLAVLMADYGVNVLSAVGRHDFASVDGFSIAVLGFSVIELAIVATAGAFHARDRISVLSCPG